MREERTHMKYCNDLVQQFANFNKKLLDESISKIKNNDNLSFEQQKAVIDELTDLVARHEQSSKDKINLLMGIDFDKLSMGLNNLEKGL